MVRAIAIRSIFDVGLFHSLLHAGCPALSWIEAKLNAPGPIELDAIESITRVLASDIPAAGPPARAPWATLAVRSTGNGPQSH
jgi:hypothetical protein